MKTRVSLKYFAGTKFYFKQTTKLEFWDKICPKRVFPKTEIVIVTLEFFIFKLV